MGQANSFQPCLHKTGAEAVDCMMANNPDTAYDPLSNGSPSEALSKQKISTMMPPESVDAYYDFLVSCNSQVQDPETPLFCFTPDWMYRNNYGEISISTDPATWGNQVVADTAPLDNTAAATPFHTFAMPYNSLGAIHFHYAAQRLNSVCGKFAPEVAPMMYQLYNTPYGKEQIDTYLKNNPDLSAPCANLLRNNYKDENAMYGLINPPDMNSEDIVQNSEYISDPYGYSGGITKLLGIQNWLDPKIEAGWHNVPLYPSQGPGHPPQFLKFAWGDPLWTHKERSAFWSAVLGRDLATGESFVQAWAEQYIGKGYATAGKGAQTYFNPEDSPGKPGWSNDPTYAGNLPYLPAYDVKGNEPWHHITQDPDQYGYHLSCDDKTWVQRIVPIAAGIICGAIAGMFVPGSKARLIAVGSAASAVYFIADDILAVENGDSDTVLAAHIIGAGACATILQCAYDIELLPVDSMLLQVSTDLAAAVFGYVFVAPRILPSMEFSGGLTGILLAPLVAIDSIVEGLFNGCAEHKNLFTSNDVCMCENANVKPLLQQALVGPIFGCTGAQYDMRLECIQAAMTHGKWGGGTYYMGNCDGNGHMDNPIACLSAGEWAYRQWPADLDQLAAPLWAECEHCFDMKDGQPWVNPSFQPPGEKDSPCVQKYGKFFRLGPDGNCYDYRAPVGSQGPGQYAWPNEQGHDPLANSNESCTIL